MGKTENIIDYAESVLEPFASRPFSEVDSLIVSEFAYMNVAQFVPARGSGAPPVTLRALYRAEYFDTLFNAMLAPQEMKRLLAALAASPRWRDVRVGEYAGTHDTQRMEQFAAMTFFFPDESTYIAFRGTDTSLLGWKEDFNMAYVCPVPSQASGLAYLESVAADVPGPLYVGGHSKGGSIAVYAAMYCSEAVRARLARVFSHDGPGFKQNIMQGETFAAIKSRICKTVPQSSMVGLLMQTHEPYRVVKSTQVGGILQHDPFSWVVQNGAFHYLPAVSGSASFMNTTLDLWLADLPDEKRALLCDALFTVLDAGKAQTVLEFASNWHTELPAMAKAASALDAETRESVLQILKALAHTSLKVLTSQREAP